MTFTMERITGTESTNGQLVGRVVAIFNRWPEERRTVDGIGAMYLYVVYATADVLYGVGITNAPGRSGWRALGLLSLSTGEATGEDTYAYPLTEVTEWPETVASFLGTSTGAGTPTSDSSQDVAEAVAAARREAREEAQRAFDAWKEQATETAHEYARNNNLCSEFDRCMEDIGLRPRSRRYAVEVSATVYVDAADDDDAINRAREELRADGDDDITGLSGDYIRVSFDSVDVAD